MSNFFSNAGSSFGASEPVDNQPGFLMRFLKEYGQPGSLSADAERLRKEQENKQLANILSGQSIATYARPGGVEPQTPEQTQQQQLAQLGALGTPAATSMLANLSPLSVKPLSNLEKLKTEAEIAKLNAEAGKANEEARKLKSPQPSPETQKQIFDEEAKLRGEFVNQSQNFIIRRDAYDNIQSLSKGTGGASDIALLTAFMKLQDPGSTVREGEFATAENAPGVSNRVLTAYNKLLEGDKLTPEARQKFVETADVTYKSAERQHGRRLKQYEGIARRAGLNPAQVLLDVTAAPNPASGTETIPIGGNINAPALPQGAKQIGTSGGKPVFQTPDGRKFVQD